MFQFWDIALAPLLAAARPRTVLEIGAFRGQTTDHLIDALDERVTLHVIDPYPDFDPREHAARFRGAYVFHRALSLEVLPTLEAVDVALVDGDHNWYTVYNELKILSRAARAARRLPPLLLLHDVAWPYGRRDLYSDPAQIPDEFKQPFAQRGIVPGQVALAKKGGLNAQLFNAQTEGGPRNGVATALDDFLAEEGRPFRTVILPINFGLAVCADEELLSREPALARVFDQLEGPSGQRALLEMSEQLRADAAVRYQELAEAALPKRRVPRVEAPRALDVFEPRANGASASPRKLSVIVVVYDMRRAAPRTLRSLSRAYQQGIEQLDYEVVVVENGSPSGAELGMELVSSFGPEFRYLDLQNAATPSPVPALQRGLDVARGDALALMIDGAHVLTPGVLHWGMAGLASSEAAVTCVHQWYLGAGQQPELIQQGYDEAAEDRLLDSIRWPAEGYDLFRIGQSIGNRDWLDPIPESNCLFVSRKLLQRAGGLDPAFDMPGGGFANLDLLERVASTPGARLLSILGEASFHQVHGGTTTNVPDTEERTRRIAEFRKHYENLRGKPFRPPANAMQYIGHLGHAAKSSRTRRRPQALPSKAALRMNGEALPAAPTRIPKTLASDYAVAFWRSLAWKRATWLGHGVRRAPADLHAYQELITRLGPDHLVVTCGEQDGLAFYLASICELAGRGEVLSVARSPAVGGNGNGDGHRNGNGNGNGTGNANGKGCPRLVRIEGEPDDPGVAAAVQERLNGGGAGLVVLGGWELRRGLLEEFEAYAPLVPVGGYVVLENTLGGGLLVGSEKTTPKRALKTILASTEGSGFEADRELEIYGPTLNPGGYLRRVAVPQASSSTPRTRLSAEARH